MSARRVLPNGRASHVYGFAHEYKRRGTTTLFTALEVATGQIKAKHTSAAARLRVPRLHETYRRDRSRLPRRRTHRRQSQVTHKPQVRDWFTQHKNVHFHFTPTHASWLNQVEIWFSILARSTLDGASFTSCEDLRAAIDAFITAYNATAIPFQWHKAKVHPKNFTPRITDL